MPGPPPAFVFLERKSNMQYSRIGLGPRFYMCMGHFIIYDNEIVICLALYIRVVAFAVCRLENLGS